MTVPAWFWAYYAAGWTPYIAALVVVFVVNGAPVTRSIVVAHEYAVPAALLGIGVFPLCRRLPLRANGRGRVLIAHVVAAVCFALLATAGALVLMSIERQRVVQFSTSVFRFHFNTNLLAYVAVAGVAYAVDHERRLRHEERRRAASDLLRARAELQALRAHLNPHFLFNAIHSLIGLTRRDPFAAQAGLERLGNLLRYSLREARTDEVEVSVKEEWDFVNDYLGLEQVRLGERLHLSTSIDPAAMPLRTLPFVLQPLVENAIRHGVATRAGAGLLQIAVTRDDRYLVFEVRDDGSGAELREVEASRGLGLRSLRQRIHAHYGEQSLVKVNTSRGSGFQVSVHIPICHA